MTHSLQVENTKIIQIPKFFFHLHWCENVQILYVKFDNLILLRSNGFKKFVNVKKLTLIANKLQWIKKKSFNKLLQLEELHLESISLKSIDKNVLNKLSRLQKLSLILQNLKIFPKKLLKNTISLKYLKMNHSCLLNGAHFPPLKHLEWTSMILLGYLYYENIILPSLKCLKLNNRDFQFNNCLPVKELTEICIEHSICVSNCMNIISESKNLKVLNLSNNINIMTLDLTMLTEQNSLTYFNMSRNCIRIILPHSFEFFENLEILNLSYNRLSIGFHLFNKLRNLKILDLSHNEIRVIHFHVLDIYLPNLRILNVGHNYVEYICHGLKTLFSYLSHMYFCNNLIKLLDLKCTTFSTNQNLILLDFQNNAIRKIDDTFFWYVRNLKYLYLNGNMIRFLNSNHFEKLECLEYLDLSRNLIRFLDYDLFEKSYNLKTLNLSLNLIKFVSEGLFRNTRRLQLLDLSHNKIAEISNNVFKFNHKLTHLYLKRNNLSCLGDKIISYSRPGFDVIDLSQNRFEIFSINIIVNNSNLNCKYIIDQKIKKYLVAEKNFDKFKFIFNDFIS